MDLNEIPMQKKAQLTQRLTMAIDEGLKRDLMELKYQYGIDISEWIRKMIRSELPRIKDACQKQF